MKPGDYAPALLQARQESGLSQKKLASSMGVTFSYVSRVERGLSEPSFGYLCAFARAVNCSLSSILHLGEMQRVQQPKAQEVP